MGKFLLTEKQLIDDLIRVSKLLKKFTVTAVEYDKHGTYSRGSYQRRFGSWLGALDKAGLDTKKYQKLKLTDIELINDLIYVANLLKKKYVSIHDYEKYGHFSAGPFFRVFGSWVKAIEEADLEEPKRKGSKSIKRIILDKYSTDELDSALKSLYPINVKSLYDLDEHIIFKKHIMDGKSLEAIAQTFSLSKGTVVKIISHVFSKILIYFNEKPTSSYFYNYTIDDYKKLDLLLYKKAAEMFFSKRIIYLWQLKKIKIHELFFNEKDLHYLCESLKQKGIKLNECHKILSHYLKGYKSRISRGSGYDGIIYAAIGCPVDKEFNYEGIQKIITNLPNRERIIVEKRYLNDKTYREIANKLGLTHERVRQVLEGILRKLRHTKWRQYYLNPQKKSIK